MKPLENKTIFLDENGDNLRFHFVCEACGCDGELTILRSEGMTPFDCPEGCGATYVPWEYAGQWKLMCVVKPFFKDA